MLFQKLINISSKEKKNLQITGLATNSKKVKKGFIFFAVKGFNLNGEDYIKEAINNGASAIVCDKNCNFTSKTIPIIKTRNIRQYLSQICSKFFELKPNNIIAVTGTNGKTSVADLFYQILNINNVPVASIGTLGIKFKGKTIKTDLTSPDTIELHQALEKLKKNKIDNVIIETSSHALDQRRIDNLKIKLGIFTNFSQDHLDYHKTMKKYLRAKLFLFSNILDKRSKIISDKSLKEFSFLKKISKKRNFSLIDISKIENRLKNSQKLNLHDFQLKNLSMAIAASKTCIKEEKKIFNAINKIKDVNGRLELIKVFPNNVKVYVDFAHTPDALLKSLKAIKTSYNTDVSLVFGCGGNRDFKKRPLMGKIASLFCKKIYVTDDNPRSENPNKIRNEIIRNIRNDNCFNIGNRFKAIKNAILNAGPNEIVLVAGKGHEEKQIYKNKIIYISDKQLIKKIKIKRRKISQRDQNFINNKIIVKNITKIKRVENFHGLSIDTRSIKKGNLFLTIKGKKNDGIKFIKKALKKGAKYIVTSKNSKKFKRKVIRVNNVIKFLNEFAIQKRNLSKAKIIGITGSAGKTSLKNLLKDLLQNFGETICSPKSFNNHLGVPLSLSQLNTKHNHGIFEIGMSKAGEINTLSKIIQPHIGVITNIGEAHIENFKNLRGIADAKGEIIKNIKKNGTIILNRDDKYFSYLEKKATKKNLKIVTFGLSRKSHYFPRKLSQNKNYKLMTIKVKNEIFKIEIKNINIYNVLSSIALLSELNYDLRKIIKHFKNYEPTEGRGKIYKVKRYKKTFKLVDESYNANPLSVKSAINNFNSIKKQNFKKYLILGDMLELGKKSEILHKNLSTVINNSDIDKVFVKGNKTLATYKKINKYKRGNILQQDEDMDFALKNIIANNDYLMIKGSNATGLNNLSKRIIKGF